MMVRVSRLAWVAPAALAWLCSACAGPEAAIPPMPANADAERARLQRAALDRAFETHQALWDLLWPLTVANADLCPDKVDPVLGFSLADRESARTFAPGLRPRQIKALTPGDDAFVLTVAAGSPAAGAGLARGDRILAVGEKTLERPVQRAALEKALKRALKDAAPEEDSAPEEDGAEDAALAPVSLTVARADGETETLPLTPVMACRVNLNLNNTPALGASAGGREINFTVGLYEALKDEKDAIAFILAHELAHSTEGHQGKVVRNFLVTGGPVVLPLVGVAGGVVDFAASFSPRQPTIPPGQDLTIRTAAALLNAEALEREADYVGAYFAARAGFDVAKGRDAFEQISVSIPGRTWYDPAHTPTPERMLTLDGVIAEIEEKRARGAPLVPNAR